MIHGQIGCIFIPWFCHLFFNIINVFCAKKTGGACLYMPQDGHGLASFAVIPPPKKLVFPPPKKFKFPIENPKRDMRTPTFEKQISDPFFFLFLFRLFLSAILSRRCRLSRTTSDPAQKVENIRPKLRFSCFSGEKIGTILSRRSRLSRTSRAPSRLSRPHPIDCANEWKQTVKIISGFGQFFFRTSSKKDFLNGSHLVLIYTPKEAHSLIFVTGGSFFARQMLAKKSSSWRGELVIVSNRVWPLW
jgi:hypothetical protein